MGAGDGGVLDFDHTRAECFFVSGCRRCYAILVSKPLDIDREVAVVFRDFYVGMTVTDRVSDAVHTDVDFVAVQVIQFAIEFCHFGLKAFPSYEVEGVGVAFRQFTRQKLKVLVPLFFGQTKSFCGNCILCVARAVQFYGTGVIGGGELATQDSSLERGLNGYCVRARLQAQMQMAGFEMTVLDSVSTGRSDQLAPITPLVTTKVKRYIELARLLAGRNAFKIARWVIRLAAGLGLGGKRQPRKHQRDRREARCVHSFDPPFSPRSGRY